jgi:predicted PurR-regulated permease PerM
MVKEDATGADQFVRNSVEAAIRILVLLLLAAWCFQIIQPFISPAVWGIIIAIAIYPGHRKLASMMSGRDAWSAALITIGMLVLLVWPTIILAGVLAENAQMLAAELRDGTLDIPPPPPAVETWPIIGQPLAKTWGLASENLQAVLVQLEPQIRAAGSWLLSAAAGTGLAILQFVLAIIIAGLLIANAEVGGHAAHDISRRLAGDRGSEFIELAGATVRGVARGIIGVAAIQAILAGLGMMVAGVPAAGLWAGLCLVLAIIQIGIAPVMIGAIIYMFSTADTIPAVLFLIWGVFVSVIDNVLKPILMGRGLDVPIAIVIVGTIGGMFSSGIVGLFIGPVILAVGYKLFVTWVAAGRPAPEVNQSPTA